MPVVFPSGESELRHIFRNAIGHLNDTPQNRSLLLAVANDIASRLESDQYGNAWAARLLPDGRQAWVRIRAGKIINGGVNETPRNFSRKTGLNNV